MAALQWSGMETAGIGGVRLRPAVAVCDFASVGSRSSKGHSLTPARLGVLGAESGAAADKSSQGSIGGEMKKAAEPF